MPDPVGPKRLVGLDGEESATVCSLGCATSSPLLRFAVHQAVVPGFRGGPAKRVAGVRCQLGELAARGAEPPGPPGRFGEIVGFREDGLDAFNDTQLRDAVAGRDGLGFG